VCYFLTSFYRPSSLSCLLSLHTYPHSRSLSCAPCVLFHTMSQPISSPQALPCAPCTVSFSFSSVLFTDFFHLSTSRVLHFIHLSDCLWHHWANHVHRSNVYHCKSIFSSPFYVYTAKKFPGMEGLPPLIPCHRPCRLCVAFYHKSLRRFLVLWLTKVSRYESERTSDRENLVPRTFLFRTASHWVPASPSRMRRAIVKVKLRHDDHSDTTNNHNSLANITSKPSNNQPQAT
jgi:hypothetical protein